MSRLDKYRDIILEALRDYRKWWADDKENEDRVEEIDRAIAFVGTD